MKNIAVLVSGGGTNLQVLIDAQGRGELINGRITAVISSTPSAYALERARGITIFSKQARLTWEGIPVTLLDTPGHVDFSAEMERTLQVLDYAVLVISGSDGIQGHTVTLWRLLAKYRIPTFLFINKMDQAGTDRDALLSEIRTRLDDSCVDFSQTGTQDFMEQVAMCDEAALEHFLETGEVAEETIRRLVCGRRLFPCCFGSALKLEGVEELLGGIIRYGTVPEYPQTFGAKIFKISRDDQGNRLTHMKITGGCLKVKSVLTGPGTGRTDVSGNKAGGPAPSGAGSQDGACWEEKVNQIRIYSGEKYEAVAEAGPGSICAVTGLTRTFPGQGLGAEAASMEPVLEPVLTYEVKLPPGCDRAVMLPKLKELEEEDPQLNVVWDGHLGEIQLQLMGEVQIEVLKSLIAERFGVEVEFGTGNIVYKETIAGSVEGVGHFEPLRHYAEVHLLLEPGERGSGLQFAARCSEDVLDRSWQRLVLTHLEEKVHKGVLTGSPITDMRITLVAGRAHIKHTEGGDFRQATYRALRQGLMEADSILLEPWYEFRLEIPDTSIGRAMTDIEKRSGTCSIAQSSSGMAVLTGSAPVAAMGDYQTEVTAYTKGCGKLTCTMKGYEPCHDTEAVMERIGYDPERDTDNPADSVFCSHGAGVTVKWDQVRAHMHVDSGLRLGGEEAPPPETPVRPAERGPAGSLEQDKELMAIFERTYGKVEQRAFQPQKKPARTSLDGEKYSIRTQKQGPEYLLVDGYNVIFAWEELERLARQDVAAARGALEDILSNYQGFRRCVVILVFDAYKVKGNPGSVERRNGIYVVYTKEAETADAYIEKTTYEIAREHRVRVVTSDGAEQLIILGHGALRLPAASFRREVEEAEGEISAILARHNRGERSRPVKEALERAAAKERSGPGSGRKR